MGLGVARIKSWCHRIGWQEDTTGANQWSRTLGCIFLWVKVTAIELNVKYESTFYYPDNDKCESCPGILEELETIDDETDEHGIQFVKSNDVKLAHEIGIFAFPALVYYETGVPIMYDGEDKN